MSGRLGAWRDRYGPVMRGVGLLLHVPGLMALASLPVCWWFQEVAGVRPLLLTAGIALGLGQPMFWVCHRTPETHRHHALMIAALAWLAVSMIGALPFALAGLPWPDAAFEGLSGFTGTGLTIIALPAELPHYLQWWRSLSQWVGGVGVIVLLLSVLPVNRSALQLYYSEARKQKILPTVRSTVQVIWSIYLGYSLAGIAMLALAGEPLWRAVNHGMTAIATGGFTITNHSIAEAAPLIKTLYLPLMVIGATSFLVHYRLLRRGELRAGLVGGLEQRLFWGLLIGGAALLAVDNALTAPAIPWLDSVFQWVSALTTAGLQSAPIGGWPVGALMLMALIMHGGAMAGSTGGGLKQLRLALLYKAFAWSLQTITRRPHEVLRLVYDGEALSSSEADNRVRAATVLTVAWLLTAVTGVLVMAHCLPSGTPLEHIIFDVVSAQANVGLSSGLTGPDMNTAGKITLMALMWMGRLEIVPVMVLLALALERARG